jgi:hypothetical protein
MADFACPPNKFFGRRGMPLCIKELGLWTSDIEVSKFRRGA